MLDSTIKRQAWAPLAVRCAVAVLALALWACDKSPAPAAAPPPPPPPPAPAPAPGPAHPTQHAADNAAAQKRGGGVLEALGVEPRSAGTVAEAVTGLRPGAQAPAPPKPMAKHSAPEDPMAAVDRLLAALPSANIAFNVPDAINLGDTAMLELDLSLDTSTSELLARIKESGAKEGAKIKVSERMEARLSGADFAITAVTPEVQAVAGTGVTQWQWEIKPTSKGQRRLLHLTLSALMDIDGTSTARAIRTFDKEIDVEVTWSDMATQFLQENWQWLWTVILAPVAAWIWARRRRRRLAA